jgi:hypothetical protein
MKEEKFDTWTGISEDGFRDAARLAVEAYERDRGIPEEAVRLRVVDMSVTVHNPIHGYRVVLGTGG